MSVVIRIDGTDITDDVFISGASFSSLVNGTPGQAVLRVKDVAQGYEFTSGGLLTLDVDSVRVWGGYVMSAKKVYALSVIDTASPPAATRIWEIVGADHNILFGKRIVFKESDPTGKINFSYDANTYDDTIIDDIFDNYLDIDDDSLTRTGVQRIAKAILDVPGKTHSGLIASAGFTWKQMMDSIQQATGGIYYLDASRDLKYVDVETSTSDYTLTDQPVGAFDVGFQGFTLLENGSDLVNDMLLWGLGIFSRTQDSSSIANHGRWQLPLVTTGIIRQASADIVADSYVYGTPQSHRGGKDDAVTFNARVFEPLFAAGDVVDVVVGIFGYSDALPVRRMTITFLSATEPIFDLILSHAIDQPVSIAEFLPPGSSRFHFPPFPGIEPPGLPSQPTPRCDCGKTDAFGRAVIGGLDTSDSGLVYVAGAGSLANWSVDGTKATLVIPSPGAQSANLILRGQRCTTAVLTSQVTATAAGDDPLDVVFLVMDAKPIVGGEFAELDFATDGTVTLYTGSGNVATTLGFTARTRFKMRLSTDGASTAQCKVWRASDPEPTAWTLTLPFTAPVLAFDYDVDIGASTGSASLTATFDELDADGVTRCDIIQFEDFEDRSYANNSHTWGDAHPGGQTWVLDTYLNTYQYVADGYGIIRNNNVVPSSSGYSFLSAHEAVIPIGSDFHIKIPIIHTSTTSVYNQVIGFTIDGTYFDWFRNGIGTPKLRAQAAAGFGSVEVSFPFPTFWPDLAGGTAIMEAERVGSVFRMRLYDAAGAVPDWQNVTTADQPGPLSSGGIPADAAYMSVSTNVSSSAAGQTELKIGQLDFDYPTRPCYVVAGDPVPPISGIPPTGKVCETIHHSGGTDFAASRAFFSGSLDVWVNGTQQTAFTFTASLGEFSLTSSIDASDELRICYRANGDPI